MNGMIIRILIALFMLPLTALFTHDPVTIAVAGTIAGVFVYFVTWTIQLAKINKTIPVDKDRMKEKIKEYEWERDEGIRHEKVFHIDPSDPLDPSWWHLKDNS